MCLQVFINKASDIGKILSTKDINLPHMTLSTLDRVIDCNLFFINNNANILKKPLFLNTKTYIALSINSVTFLCNRKYILA